MPDTIHNIDAVELEKFEDLAGEWWDPQGKLRTLHHINPTRLRYINNAVSLAGKKVLDLGCGGGLLAEAMAERGADVTGLDAGSTAIETARQHQRLSGYNIDYINGSAEEFAAEQPASYDVVTCMELLEHVPDVTSLLASCRRVLKPGGQLILSTINRNLKAYLTAIVGAEYLLGLLPKNTHQYAKFIKPSELSAWLRQSGFTIMDIAGMHYIPGVNSCSLTNNPSVNYLLHARLQA